MNSLAMAKGLSLKIMMLLLPYFGFLPSTGIHVKPNATNAASANQELLSHDPSPSSLTLPKPIPQLDLAIHGSLISIAGGVLQAPFVFPRASFPLLYSDVVKTPEQFRFLAMQKKHFVPRASEGPALINSDFEFTGISDRRFGFCWGFSTMIRNFSTLAFFDPSLPRVPSTDFYKNLVDQVLRGKATVIPGYRNFRELTLNPELELYLKLYTMVLWRDLAVRPSSLSILFNAGRGMSAPEIENFLSDLDARLARGEFPKVIFSSRFPNSKLLGLNTDIHVVLAYRVEHLANQTTRLYLWDNNFYAETMEKTPKFIEVTADHQLIYSAWHDSQKSADQNNDLLARISITPENDAETAASLIELERFCTGALTSHYCSTSGSEVF